MKKRRILFVFAVAAVVVASLIADPYVPTADFVPGVASDKVWHTVGYFVLTLVALYVFDDKRPLFVAVGVVLLGAGVELAQAFVPYRTASLLDMTANTVGVVVAVAVASLVPTD